MAGSFTGTVIDWVISILEVYVWIVIIAAVFSWLMAFGIIDTRNQAVRTVGNFLYRVTEPALRPIQRIVPHLGGIDISPIILFFIILYAH